MEHDTTIEAPAPVAPPSPRRGWLWLGATIGIILVAIGAWGLAPGVRTLTANVTGPRIGAPAPEIVLPQLENGKAGKKVALSSLRGRPVVLNFWATWCIPCRAEFPAFNAKYRQYKDSQKLIVIAVNVEGEDGAELAQKFVGETGVQFPIWLDVDGSAANTYRVQALPTTLFIDRDGIIRDMIVGGPMTAEYIESELKKIF